MTEISKQALLRALLSRQRGEADLVADAPAAAFASTAFQSAIYLAEAFRDGPSGYHVPVGLRIEGTIDLGVLQAALQRVVERHDVLRGAFAIENGRLMQRTLVDARVAWDVRDARGQADPLEVLAPWLSEFVARPFALANAIPVRAAAIRVSDGLHVVVVVVHHIVFDGWSRPLLIGEIARHYELIAAGRGERLPPLRRQYMHYALERARDRDADAKLGAHRDYLVDLLREADVLLPVDAPRRDVSAFACASVPLTMSREIADRARLLQQGERVTAFVFFLAVFNLLLHGYAGRGGTRIACPVTCRERAEDMELIGCFVNTLVLKASVDPEQDFTAYLRAFRDRVLQVLAYKNHPVGLSGLAPPRDAEALAPYRVMFAFQDRPSDTQRSEGLRIEPFVLHGETTKFELTLLLDSDGTSLTGAIEYRSDLFRRSTIERLRAAYVALVNHALGRPQARVRDLMALAGLDAASLPPPPAVGEAPFFCVHERVMAWAREAPDRIAIESDAGSLSYAALARCMQRWSAHLRALGVGAEERVGVAADLGADAIPAMLAVLAAGAAYVPLDLEHPAARLAAQVEASAVRWILSADAARAGELGAARVVRFSARGAPPQAPIRVAPVPLAADSLAYVIYTSGTAGAPKGVMVTHGGLANYLSWCVERYAMAAAPSLAHTSLLSDMTVTTIWGPLVAGQRVHVAARAQGVEGLRAALAREEAFAVVKLTPSHLRILQQERARFGARAWCRTCVIGGEALSEADIAPWRALGMRFVNEYGPSETVVGSSAYESAAAENATAVPIGAPIAHTRIAVLDERLETVPAGARGEICIGGAGVARGYERQPALTATAFLPERGAPAGARAYRTGDLALRLANSDLVYSGRRDDQFKLRGHRVERGEVEAAIAAHPGVRHAAVSLQQDGAFASLLVDVELAPGQAPSAQELRAFAARTLPSYMLPQSFRFIEAMPLLANGKIDRRALAELAPARPIEPAPPAAAPAPAAHGGDDLEVRILAVWRDVLGAESIEPTENFFEAGGDSLRLYAVYRQLVEDFGREFPAIALFEYPTARSCAAYLRSLAAGAAAVSSPPGGDGDEADRERERLVRMNRTLRAGGEAA